MEHIIEANMLERKFESKKGYIRKKKYCVTAVDQISFHVNKGEIFGLLGQNGAGKTTTIKMLITLLAPTSGECRVLGMDVMKDYRKIRKRINFVFGGELGVYRRLSARDNLIYFAGLHKIYGEVANQRVQELLDLVELTGKEDVLVETYSKGMIQRLQIARGLINDPEIFFMDEPTIGLDPIGAKMLRNTILKMKEKGKTILLTTHYLYEADELCDRIAIMNQGKLLVVDTPENIKKEYSTEKDESLEDIYVKLISENQKTGEVK